jgi:hypothetical protein
MSLRVLVACEFSGIVRDAFIAKGHDAWSCDLLPTEREGPHILGDVLDVLNEDWDLMIAHPPCTYLTVTGNKWFKPEYKERFPTREQDREDAIRFFTKLSCADIYIKRICIENPIGIMSTKYKKPSQIIQPWQFGHTDSKSTCLWLKNLPLLHPTKIVEPNMKTNRNGKRASVHHDEALRLPADERWKVRSRTYEGIAEAMASQWDF